MSATVLQYPPTSPRTSFLSSTTGDENNNRASIASTSAASYETALASAAPSGASDSVPNVNALNSSSSSSSSSSSGFGAGDETLGPQTSPTTKVNPLHILANSQSEGGEAPIHITRVSQDTVYVKQSGSRNPTSARVHRAGKALADSLDNGRHRVATMMVPSSNTANGIADGLRTGGNVAGAHSHSASAAVEGPNGLTPPPSPPSTTDEHTGASNAAPHTSALAGSGAIFGGPTFDEPSVEETFVSDPPLTPTKMSMHGSASPSEFTTLSVLAPVILNSYNCSTSVHAKRTPRRSIRSNGRTVPHEPDVRIHLCLPPSNSIP